MRRWQRIYHATQETTLYFAILQISVLSVSLYAMFYYLLPLTMIIYQLRSNVQQSSHKSEYFDRRLNKKVGNRLAFLKPRAFCLWIYKDRYMSLFCFQQSWKCPLFFTVKASFLRVKDWKAPSGTYRMFMFLQENLKIILLGFCC